jgi:hypothetical protein
MRLKCAAAAPKEMRVIQSLPLHQIFVPFCGDFRVDLA